MGYPNLRALRKAQGFSQQQMAFLLGLISRNAYALKESGKRRFTIEEALALSRLLGVSVELLFSSPEVTILVTSENAPRR